MSRKTCSSCKTEKPETKFYPDKRMASGRENICHDCKSDKPLYTRLKKAAKAELKRGPSDGYTVYGYLETRRGLTRYVGCTRTPAQRRRAHEVPSRGVDNAKYLRRHGFTYHVYASGLSRCEALGLEKELIAVYNDRLENTDPGQNPSECRGSSFSSWEF